MIKRIIYRTVAFAIIIAGLKFAFTSKRPGSDITVEQEYNQKMAELSKRYDEIEKSTEAANLKAASKGKTPGTADELLGTLMKLHRDKDQYLADLKKLDVPKKYEEAHTTFLAWRKQEQETEGKLIEGYKAFNAGKKSVGASIDSMLESSEKASKEYQSKIDEITKKGGIESFKKFFGQK